MDTATHALIPFVLYVLYRRPWHERSAALVGGLAPDLDAFFAWASRLDGSLYSFVHRGWSHTPWGGFVLAVLLYSALQAPFLRRRWPRMRAFSWEPGLGEELALLFGVLTHLLLDALTITGVPLFWPLTTGRVAVPFFFFSIPYLLPLSGLVLGLRFAGKLDDRKLFIGTGLVVLVVLGVAGVRLATYPAGTPPEAIIEPTPVDTRWTVLVPASWPVGEGEVLSGYNVTVYRRGEPGGTTLVLGNATGEASRAIARARATGEYVAWHWDSSFAVVVNATRTEDGWVVEFRDAARIAAPWPYSGTFRRLLGHDPPASPWDEPLAFRVPDDGPLEVLERPRGYLS